MLTNAFPVTIFDNFLEDPNKVVDFALSQNFTVEESGRWPGKRTQCLSIIYPTLYRMVLNKVFYVYGYEVENCSCYMTFQLIDKKYKSGWVHQDKETITGIIYLNSISNIDGGTTIYTGKNAVPSLLHSQSKAAFFSDNVEDVDNERSEHNNQFEESIVIKNRFNRLILFESFLYHGANNFFNDNEKERLTLVFFIDNIKSSDYTPVDRVRRYHPL